MTDPIATTAEFLLRQLPWLRHQRFADEALADIAAAARIVRGILEGPSEQKYLGPCGATLCSLCGQVEAEHVCEGDIPVWVCDGDVSARVYADGTVARQGACRTCKTPADTEPRLRWLDSEVRQRAYTAKEISDAYDINVKTIRSWADRGHLTQHGQDRDGRPLYLLGDVLDLASRDAARREERRAERERQAERMSA